jgi:hypothetical protein
MAAVAALGCCFRHPGWFGGTGGGGYTSRSGAGGTGVVLSGGGFADNAATITGGTGGYSSYAAKGGTGVYLQGGTLQTSGLIAGGEGDAIKFGGQGGTVIAEQGASIQGALCGWGTGDTVDLRDIQATTLTYMNGTLTLYDGSTAVDALTFQGSYTVSDFALLADGQGGTSVYDPGAHEFARDDASHDLVAGGLAAPCAWAGDLLVQWHVAFGHL